MKDNDDDVPGKISLSNSFKRETGKEDSTIIEFKQLHIEQPTTSSPKTPHIKIVDNDTQRHKQLTFAEANATESSRLGTTKKYTHGAKLVDKKYIVEDLEKPWNYRIMSQLQNIGEKSLGYKWMHNEEMCYYTYRLTFVTTVEIVFAALHGASLLGSIVSLFDADNSFILYVTLTLVQGLFYIGHTIMKTYKEASDFPGKIYEHRWSSIEFSRIATAIQNQFCMPISKRDNDENFLDYKTGEFDSAQFGAPVIRTETKNRYIEGTKDSDISKPMTLGDIDKIEIVIDKSEEDVEITDVNLKSREKDIMRNIDNKFQYEYDRFLRMC